MIFNVLIYDDFGHYVEDYRLGAWDEDHAEDIVSTKLVKRFGANAPNMSFILVPEDKIFLPIPDYAVLNARDAFFDGLGLTHLR